MIHEKPFKIKCYSKQELARLYNPHLSPLCARRMLRRWIVRNRELSGRLEALGAQPTDRTFTPRQVEAIVHYLGEP